MLGSRGKCLLCSRSEHTAQDTDSEQSFLLIGTTAGTSTVMSDIFFGNLI